MQDENLGRAYADANNGVPSCWNCKHSYKSLGCGSTFYDPGEPPMAECEVFGLYGGNYPSPVLELIMDWELKYEGYAEKWEEDARNCDLYEAMILGECEQCGEYHELPLTECQQLTIFDNSWYCSVECFTIAKTRFDEEQAMLRERGVEL